MYAKIMINTTSGSPEEVEYHLGRAYSLGDRNYDAQLLHARQLYVNGRLDESRTILSSLSSAKLPFNLKHEPRYPLSDRYHGEVCRVEVTYCFIRRDGPFDMIYCNRDSQDPAVWRRLVPGRRIGFGIAFNMRGPIATDVVTED